VFRAVHEPRAVENSQPAFSLKFGVNVKLPTDPQAASGFFAWQEAVGCDGPRIWSCPRMAGVCAGLEGRGRGETRQRKLWPGGFSAPAIGWLNPCFASHRHTR
jgi:hypothetical protein